MSNLCAECGHSTNDHDSLFECSALVESLFGAETCECRIFVKDDFDE